jgi:uncharacterized protein
VKKFTVKPRYTSTNIAAIGAPQERNSEWVYMGRLGEIGPLVDVHFDTHYPHVFAILGKRGSGKSYTMGSMLEGLCTEENQTSISNIERNTATLLLDTLGIFQWTDISLEDASESDVLKRQRETWRNWKLQPEKLDVQIWIPKGTRTDQTPDSHREFAVRTSDFSADDWGYLLGLDIYQDRMGQLLNDAYIKVTLEGWQGSEGHHKKPSKHYSLSELVQCIKQDTELNESYRPETQRAVLQQLTTFQRNPLFEDEGTPLMELLAPGQMNVLVMNRMSIPLRLVILSSVIRRLMDERMEASEVEKHLTIRTDMGEDERANLERYLETAIPRTIVALDEAQNILASERRTSAGEMLTRYVREGRNYGLSFMVATQQPTAIDSRILAQVDTIIAHKLTVQTDIDYVKRNLKSNMPQEIVHGGRTLEFDELMRSLDVGQALVSNTEADRAVIVDIRPRISVHGGF